MLRLLDAALSQSANSISFLLHNLIPYLFLTDSVPYHRVIFRFDTIHIIIDISSFPRILYDYDYLHYLCVNQRAIYLHGSEFKSFIEVLVQKLPHTRRKSWIAVGIRDIFYEGRQFESNARKIRRLEGTD